MFASAFDNYIINETTNKTSFLGQHIKEKHTAIFMLVDDIPSLILCHMKNLPKENSHMEQLTLIDLTRVYSVNTNDGITKITGTSGFSRSMTSRRLNHVENSLPTIPQDLRNKVPNTESIIIVKEKYSESIHDVLQKALTEIKNQNPYEKPNYRSRNLLVPDPKLANTLINTSYKKLCEQGNKIALQPKTLSTRTILLITVAISNFLTTFMLMGNQSTAATTALITTGCIATIIAMIMPMMTVRAKITANTYAAKKAFVPLNPHAAIIREENKRYLLISQTPNPNERTYQETLILISGSDNLPTHKTEPANNTITFTGDNIWSQTSIRRDLWEEIVPSRDISYMSQIDTFTVADIFYPSLQEVAKRAAQL